MLNKGKFFVLTGIDGSGKTTTLNALHDEFGIKIANWHQLEHTNTQLPFPRTDKPDVAVTLLPPTIRALFIAYYAFALYEYCTHPVVDGGSVIGVESYYYKFYAKEKTYAVAAPFLFRVLRSLPKPDVVIHLDVLPSVIYERSPVLNRYEYRSTPTRSDFEDFQAQVNRELHRITRGTRRFSVDASKSIEAVVTNVVRILRVEKLL